MPGIPLNVLSKGLQPLVLASAEGEGWSAGPMVTLISVVTTPVVKGFSFRGLRKPLSLSRRL